MEHFKTVLKLVKYGHQIGMNVGFSVAFLAYGIFSRWVGMGSVSAFEMVFFFMPAIFLCQIIYGLDCGEMITSSHLKKWLTVYAPDIMVDVLVALMLMLYWGIGELRGDNQHLSQWGSFTGQTGNAMLCAGLMTFVLMCYLAGCYKYYWISTISFIFSMIAYGALGSLFIFPDEMGNDGVVAGIRLTENQGLVAMILLYLAGVIVSGILRRLLYKVPVSKKAIGKVLGEQI